MRRLVISIVSLSIGLGGTALGQEVPSDRLVDVVDIDGAIDPPVADYLAARLAAAKRDGVHALILQIDTPGGLDVSMRSIVQDILDSPVPVVAWVSPRGAHAASAGTFIMAASHLSFMAPATNLGAATPVNLSGETVSTKATNDAVALLEELLSERDRDTTWAADAVEDAVSIGASEAEQRGVVEGIATSLDDLLQQLDGQTVATSTASSTLETWDEDTDLISVTLRFQQLNVWQRLLHTVTDPEIAFFLLLLGMFGLIFELYNPGIGLAGVLGAGSLLLGFYALSVLPTNWAGVGFIVTAIAFMLIDVQAAGLGVFTIGGIASLILGGVLLYSGAPEGFSLSPVTIGAAVFLTMVFFISVITAALRVRLRRPVTGEDALVGLIGEARTDIAPEGTVFTKGMLWRARTMEMGIAAGERVKIMASEGLVLLVEPLHGETDDGVPGPTGSADQNAGQPTA